MMPPSDVLAVMGQLAAAGIPVWLDGGWGVDAPGLYAGRPKERGRVLCDHEVRRV